MQRNLMGLIALLLLVAGGVAALSYTSPTSSASWAGGAIKIGLVLGAIWLALPQIERFLRKTPQWLLVVSLIGILLIAVRPWAAVAVVPLLIGMWIFGPRIASQADATLGSWLAGKKTRRGKNKSS